MDSPTTEASRNATHETPHVVALKGDSYMGVYEVTQRQFVLIHGGMTSRTKFKGDTMPMEGVCYIDLRGKAADNYDWPTDGHDVSSRLFIGRLRVHSGVSGFDLPTDAQWEFAYRTGRQLCAGLDSVNADIPAGVCMPGWYWEKGRLHPRLVANAGEGRT